MNKIMPITTTEFSLIYMPPPPSPIEVLFTLNKRERWAQQDIDCIMTAFHHFIYRTTKFMDRFKGAKKVLIGIVKGFHFDEPDQHKRQPNHCEHINVFIDIDGVRGAITHHVYFTKNRTAITQMSQLTYEKFDFH